MFPVPSTEKLIETKVCRQCQTSFPITDKDMEFYDKVSPVFNWQKFPIPTPTLCPDCRRQRRMAFRNERKLYKRNCDATGKEIISIYSPDKNLKVYHQEEWWSDRWNSLVYWLNYNPLVSFFAQYNLLQSVFPRQNIWWTGNVNCEYSNFLMNSKDCYLSISGRDNIWSHYSRNVRDCMDVVDCLQVMWCTNTYNIVVWANCYDVVDSLHVFDSRNSKYLFYCHNCIDCTGCINMRWKQFCFFNKQYSETDYQDLIKQFNALSLKDQQKKIHDHIITFPRRQLNAFENEMFTWIDYVRNSKNIKTSLFLAECENCFYCFEQEKSSNLFDCTMWGNGNNYCYEWIAIGLNSFNNSFFTYSSANSDCFYVDSCFNSSHLFGCIGLRNKQYCILNKQYTKAEYETLVPKIIEHMQKTWEWWEFFPASLSPFWYNETVASEYFPLEKSEALKLGYNWSDYEAPFPKVEKIIPASKLPDDITKIPDDILNWAIECEVTWKPFRIIKQELEFYRKHNLPIPRRHPDQRHKDRMELRNPRKLFERKCDKCQKDILTTYAPERSEIVYCEECYNNTVT